MESEDLGSVAVQVGAAVARELAKHDDRAKQRRSEELAATALRMVKDEYRSAREKAQAQAVQVVADYCSDARVRALRGFKGDARMPRQVNYRERYAAIVRMESTDEVLRRIGQTLDAADAALQGARAADPAGAFADVAAEYTQAVELLDGITVGAPDNKVRDKTADAMRPDFDAETVEEEDLQAIEDAFAQAMGPSFDLENGSTAASKEAVNQTFDLADRLAPAIGAARKAAEAAARKAAFSAQGNVLQMPFFPQFDAGSAQTGGSAAAEKPDAGQVALLAAEVRKSFDTFRQVAHDNGLFAVFARESAFAAGKVHRYVPLWTEELFGGDDDREPGKKLDVPDTVEEDEGGDTLERSIERMRAFNAKRYFGLLDDDFQVHVDAFWYGFKKLMENVNALCAVDPSAFNKYCNDIAAQAKRAVAEMDAASMDEAQLKAFRECVSSKAHQVRAADTSERNAVPADAMVGKDER